MSEPMQQPNNPAEAIKAVLESAGSDESSQRIALERLKELHESQAKVQAEGQAAQAAGQAQAQPPLPIDWSTEGVPAATNGLQVMHRPTEFAVVFTDHTPFPGRHSPDGTSGNERAVVVSSLRMTPDAMFQAICTLANSWNRFATTVIDPRMRQPRFKLLDAGDLQLEGIDKD